ncbi:hypothetical protein AB0F17_51985 [Nonomuraea sp. NPDC026600]|uniref:hypothetical protein n=1 Tax=Nonomuraea sp. NPDC026600 TaxID=3155363 RepID=UPI0033D93366
MSLTRDTDMRKSPANLWHPEPGVRTLPRAADARTAGPTGQATDATGSAAQGPVADS